MQLPAQLLRNRPQVHKGDFGHVLILAGSPQYSGAALLAAESALRCGAGLVTLGVPRGLLKAFIACKPVEAMLFPLSETDEGSLSVQGYNQILDFMEKVDALAIGPGLGRHPSTQSLILKIVKNVLKPMVVDADGLYALRNKLISIRSFRQKKFSSCGMSAFPLVVTPHTKEMAVLLGKTVKEIEADRIGLAKRCALDLESVVILKGHQSVVTDGRKVYLNKTGNPGMATAGSGDVLTGMIAAFLGQKVEAFSAARFACFLHGRAGDLAALKMTRICLNASDIIAKIPAAIKELS